MQISPLGGWLVSALQIPIGGEWHYSSTDFNPNTNSSNLPQCKSKLQVHIKPTPTKQNPKQTIVCTSDVKQTFFQDRLLSFSYKRPQKNRIYSFLKQNSLSEQNNLFQISKFLVQKQLVCSVSKFFLRLQNVLFFF
jgi:hypothetical protein